MLPMPTGIHRAPMMASFVMLYFAAYENDVRSVTRQSIITQNYDRVRDWHQKDWIGCMSNEIREYRVPPTVVREHDEALRNRLKGQTLHLSNHGRYG